MVKKIESIRISNKVSKSALIKGIGVSRSQYYKYLEGGYVPYDVVERAFDYLGYKLVLIRKEDYDGV